MHQVEVNQQQQQLLLQSAAPDDINVQYSPSDTDVDQLPGQQLTPDDYLL